MNQANEDQIGVLRKFELPILGLSALALLSVIDRTIEQKHNIPFAAFLALFMFLYLTRYVQEASQRSQSFFGGLAAIIALCVATFTQVRYLDPVIQGHPEAILVNTTLMGILVSTVLYLYLIGGGIKVIESYARRFNPKYQGTKRWYLVHSVLLAWFAISVSRHLIVLAILGRAR